MSMKEDLLKKIADMEYEFFKNLRMENEECKKEKAFKLMRMARFYPLSEDTLKSYMEDLKRFLEEGENIMALKYKCIEGGLLQGGEIVEEIVEIESQWMKDLKRRYPRAFANRIEDFERYLRCELLTFSPETLRYYHRDVLEAKENGINMAEIAYVYLFRKIGYGSIEEAEKSHLERVK